jgi:hypothetical protein
MTPETVLITFLLALVAALFVLSLFFYMQAGFARIDLGYYKELLNIDLAKLEVDRYKALLEIERSLTAIYRNIADEAIRKLNAVEEDDES